MKYSRPLVSLALLASLSAGAALAQDTAAADQGSGAPAFSDIAKDKSTIARKDLPKDVDALKPLRAHFTEADLNHDGKLDKSEYDTYVNKSSRPQPTQR